MATTIANLSKNSETMGKFFHVLGEEGIPDEFIHVVMNDRNARRQLKLFVDALIGNSANTSSYQRARDILGQDFISPQEITDARGVTYTETQLAHLQETLPDKEVLQWARDNGFIVVAGPPREMNFLDIRELNSKLLCGKSYSGYVSSFQMFSRNDMVDTTWLVLSKDLVPNSNSKTWSEQQDLVKDNERVPNIAEAVWGFTTYKEVRGIRLLPNLYVRTSSVNLGSSHVDVGDFYGDGLRINTYDSDGYRYVDLGVLSARKF